MTPPVSALPTYLPMYVLRKPTKQSHCMVMSAIWCYKPREEGTLMHGNGSTKKQKANE